MFDDLERLRNNPQLLELFFHYAKLGEPNREIWQARLMQMEGVGATEMSKLHGELIAFDWIETNIGQMPCCYRITYAGLRAYRQVHRPEEEMVVTEVVNQAA